MKIDSWLARRNHLAPHLFGWASVNGESNLAGAEFVQTFSFRTTAGSPPSITAAAKQRQ